MIRSEILKEIAPILNPHLVVCNIGLPSQELHMIDDNRRTSICSAQWVLAPPSVWPCAGAGQACDLH